MQEQGLNKLLELDYLLQYMNGVAVRGKKQRRGKEKKLTAFIESEEIRTRMLIENLEQEFQSLPRRPASQLLRVMSAR